MYIPNNKILPEVYYTNGSEYYYPNGSTEYKGYYHLDTYGNAWSGKTHTVDSLKLVPSSNNPSILPDYNNSGEAYTYTRLNPSTNNILVELPPSDSLPPTQQNYEQTYYTRYIMQYLLSSQPVFVEVNKDTYFDYFNGTSKPYFKYAEVLWKISGPLYDIVENGILKVGGVIDSNKRSIQQAQKTMPGIENYITNYVLYYKD